MNLYRRWDERLGRHRPDSELEKGGRRRQKHSIFTEAKLAPPPDASDPEGEDDQNQGNDQHHVAPQPWSPGLQGTHDVGDSPVGQSQRPSRGRPPAQPAPQLDPAFNRSADPDVATRNA